MEEILGFLGPTGAGKTRTMKMVTQFYNTTKAILASVSLSAAELNKKNQQLF